MHVTSQKEEKKKKGKGNGKEGGKKKRKGKRKCIQTNERTYLCPYCKLVKFEHTHRPIPNNRLGGLQCITECFH